MTKKLSVFIVQTDPYYTTMFKNRGWEVVNNINDADLVQFTGGSDVSPSMYKEARHPATQSNPERDKKEALIFEQAKELAIPMAGICRGGQFLNVMNNGKMWQDVNHHGSPHPAVIVGFNKTIEVSSTHHQMMKPDHFTDSIILLTANESTKKEYMSANHVVSRLVTKDYPEDDVEAVYYPRSNALCFQPHPEYPGYDDCQDVYFWFIHNYLLTGENPNRLVDGIPF